MKVKVKKPVCPCCKKGELFLSCGKYWCNKCKYARPKESEVIKRPRLQSPKAAELPEYQLTVDAGVMVYSVRVRAESKKAARRVVKTLMVWMNSSTPLGFVMGNPPDRALIDHYLLFRPEEIEEMEIKRVK